MQKKQITALFLLALAFVAFYFCYLITRPFLGSFFFAVMIAIVFHPMHAYLCSHIRGQNIAAVVSTLLVLLLIIIPMIGLGAIVSNEITKLYGWLSESSTQQGGWTTFIVHVQERVLSRLSNYVHISPLDLRKSLLHWLQQINQPLLYWQVQAVSNVFVFILHAVFAFVILFFLFREGRDMKKRLAAILPLDASQMEHLFAGVNDSIVANVYGCFAVGVAQGLLVGLAFWVLGLPSPALWGLVTGLFSMIPVVGSASVWVPAAVILAFSGHWVKALALAGWGMVVVAQTDNLIRAYVISKRANLHPLAVFFATLGGAQAFGVIGIFTGPVILSVAVVVFELLRGTVTGENVSDVAA